MSEDASTKFMKGQKLCHQGKVNWSSSLVNLNYFFKILIAYYWASCRSIWCIFTMKTSNNIVKVGAYDVHLVNMYKFFWYFLLKYKPSNRMWEHIWDEEEYLLWNIFSCTETEKKCKKFIDLLLGNLLTK